MIRPATPEAVERLRRAATAADVELDTALMCLGVLPPADLEPIRRCLLEPSTVIVPQRNNDGHRLLSVHDPCGAVAWIHHDGRVVHNRRELAAAV